MKALHIWCNPLFKNKMEIELDVGTVQLNLYNIPRFFRKAYILTPFRNESFLEKLNRNTDEIIIIKIKEIIIFCLGSQ